MHGAFKPIPSPQRVQPNQPWRITAFIAWLDRCLTRLQQRRLLRELNSDQLKDVGLSRADVERECRRWPWDGRAGDV